MAEQQQKAATIHHWEYLKANFFGEDQVTVSEPELLVLIRQGAIQTSTKVCSLTRTKGQWTTAGSIPGLLKLIDAANQERDAQKVEIAKANAQAKVELAKIKADAKAVARDQANARAKAEADAKLALAEAQPIQYAPVQPTPVTNQTVVIQQKKSNGLGMAGFITSLISLVSCGLLSPLSFVLSFFGLFFQPRGYAFAGALISLFSGAVLFVCWGLFLGALVVGSGAVEQVEQARARVTMKMEVIEFYEAKDRLPNEIEFKAILAMQNLSTRFDWIKAEGSVLTFRENTKNGDRELTLDAAEMFVADGNVEEPKN